MKNFIQPGHVVTATAPSGGVLSGAFVIIGALAGVAAVSAAQGEAFELKRQGVFSLPKATGATWGIGDQLFWDAGNSKFTKTAAGNKPMGFAAAPAGSGDEVGNVLLPGGREGLRVVCGQQTTASAADTVVTGLAKVLAAVAGFETDPADANTYVSCQIGDQNGAPAAGSIIIKTWKNTGGNDPTPAAADSFAKVVNWVAVGF